jgi:hypothetical protein
MMGASEASESKASPNMTMIQSRFEKINRPKESLQQKQERLIAEGKIVLSASGRPMFPRQPGQ